MFFIESQDVVNLHDFKKDSFMVKISDFFFAAVILFFSVFPSGSSAEDFTIKGYSLSMVNLVQDGANLKVSGRIEYGDYCGLLKLSIIIQSEKGKRKTIICNVKDAGKGSSLFEGTGKTRKNEDSSWSIVDAKVKCMDSPVFY